MAKITPKSIADLKALFQDNEKALGANFSQLIDFFNDNKVTDNGDGTFSVGNTIINVNDIVQEPEVRSIILSQLKASTDLATKEQLDTKADTSAIDPSVMAKRVLTADDDVLSLDVGTYWVWGSMPKNYPTTVPWGTVVVKLKPTSNNSQNEIVEVTDVSNTRLINTYAGSPIHWSGWRVPNSNTMASKTDLTTAISTATANMADDLKVAHLSGANNFDTVPTVNNNPLLLASSLPSDPAFVGLQTQVNNQETDLNNNINSKLSQISSVPETFANLAALQAKYPNGKTGLFVTADNGHKYIWTNNTWTDAGVYQSVGIAEGSITAANLVANATFGFVYPGSSPLKYDTKSQKLLFPPDTSVGYRGGTEYVSVNKTSTDIALTVDARGWIYIDTVTGEPGFSHQPIQDQNMVVIGGKLSDSNIYLNGPYLIDGLEPLSQYAAIKFVDIFESGKMPNFDSTTNSLHFGNEYAAVDRANPIQIVNKLGEKEFDFDLTDKYGFILIDRITGVIQNELSTGDISSGYLVIGGVRINGKLKLNGLFTVDGTYYDDLEAAPNYNFFFSIPNKAIIWNTDKRTLAFHGAFINFGRRSIGMKEQTLTYEKSGTYYIYWNKDNSEVEIEQPPVNVVNSRFQLGWFNTYNKIIYMNTDSNCIKIVPKTQSDYDLSANDNLTFFGDSITFGLHASDSNHSYPAVISRTAGITVYNEGVSGATWQNGSGNDTISLATRSKSIDFTRGNTIVLFAGTNDFAQALPIGKLTDTTDKTMLGAINTVINNIYAKNPMADIRLVLPMWRARINDASKFVDIETTPNYKGLYLKDYNDAIKSVGERYHLPTLDLYHGFNINELNYKYWLADGLHPNDTGYAKLANIIGNFISRS